ncbi:ComEA family DNA-binding protein [Streptomyces sp. NPDC048636]|uniref:ComEA family DNA-binding protein n=1 Tax=Streptomyces sp. NPDC048636 TaxID=3155762 RepID=UPI00342346D7
MRDSGPPESRQTDTGQTSGCGAVALGSRDGPEEGARARPAPRWADTAESEPQSDGAGAGAGAGTRAGDGAGEAGADTDGGGALRRRERIRLALRERLPTWLQVRCGMRLRTLAALTAALLVAVAFAVYHFWTGRPQTVRAPEPEPPRAAPAGPVPTPGGRPGPSAGRSVVVDVTGKVRRPGLRTLPSGARVDDALEAAGGARPGADTSGLNRARPLVDGEQIVVGAPGVPAGQAPGAPPAAAATGAGGGAGPGTGAPGPAGGPGVPGAPVSLNSATPEQLDTLPGVGPVLARHILDYRTQHGGFRSVDELREVTGIGERRFADLRPLVRP